MVGVDPMSCGLSGGEILFGQLSPLHPVTLDEETKAAANIPADSKHFAWAYPVVDDGALVAGSSAEHMFLRYGGYVYFNRSGEAIGTNSIAPAPLGTLGLMFGRAQELASSVEGTLTRQGRFQEITLAPLLEAGATHFAWIRPGEFVGTTAAADGAFAYQFGQAPAKYFPVVGTPVFTPEMLEEDLDDNEAWVVVQPAHPTVERVVMFDRGRSFKDNMQQAGLGSLVRADDRFVLVSRARSKQPVPYTGWQKEGGETGTIADPWILTLSTGWNFESQRLVGGLGGDVIES